MVAPKFDSSVENDMEKHHISYSTVENRFIINMFGRVIAWINKTKTILLYLAYKQGR